MIEKFWYPLCGYIFGWCGKSRDDVCKFKLTSFPGYPIDCKYFVKEHPLTKLSPIKLEREDNLNGA